MLDVHRDLLLHSPPVADPDDNLPSVDWAAFDSAQASEDRPALFKVYPAYEAWFNSRQLPPLAASPDGPSGALDVTGAAVAQEAPVRVVERVVERRVLVIRCKFCADITPVDLAVCEHCGAGEFY